MKRISFNPRFVNKTGDGLIKGKIHTIRQNVEYWRKFEGKELALFTWEGKPYRSKQKVFCVKRLVSVQEIILSENVNFSLPDNKQIDYHLLATNDGFDYTYEYVMWFEKYPLGKMAVLHFTDFQY